MRNGLLQGLIANNWAGGGVNYYKRHVGDYAKKAGHLSVLEHGVYTLLLDAYYDREQAPTKAEAIRLSRCRTPDELAALEAVLADFFTLTDGRYVQARVEQEFVLAEGQAEKNRVNGKAGGRPRKPKGNPVGFQVVAKQNPSESEKNPNPLIHQSINPEEDQKQKRGGKPLAIPEWLPADVWQDWHTYRNAHKGWTRKAQELSLRSLSEIHEQGHDPRKVIELAIERGWRGLFAPNARAGPPVVKPSAAADFRGKSYAGTPTDQLPTYLRAAVERAENG